MRSLWLSLWESGSEEGNYIIGEVITEKDPGNLAPFSFSFLGSKTPTAFPTFVLWCTLSHINTKTTGSRDNELDTPDYEPKQRFLILKVPCLWDNICFLFSFLWKEFHSVAQDDLELWVILLPQLHPCWDHYCEPICLDILSQWQKISKWGWRKNWIIVQPNDLEDEGRNGALKMKDWRDFFYLWTTINFPHCGN